MVPLIAVMAIGPMLSWKRGDLKGALSRLWVAGVAAVVFFVVAWLAVGGAYEELFAAAGFGLAGWLIVGTLVEWAERVKLFRAPLAESGRRARRLPRAAWGMTLAHAGMGLIIMGVTASSAWKEEAVQTMAIGDTVTLNGWSFTLLDVEEGMGPNYRLTEGTFRLSRDGEEVGLLTPESRVYTQPPRPTTEAAIHTTGFHDLYAVIGEAAADGRGWVTRLYFEPLVPFLWYGALLMALGGFVSLSDRRHRVGAPVRTATLPAGAAGARA